VRAGSSGALAAAALVAPPMTSTGACFGPDVARRLLARASEPLEVRRPPPTAAAAAQGSRPAPRPLPACTPSNDTPALPQPAQPHPRPQPPPQAIPNEPALLQELRLRLGPHADEARLLQALRAQKRVSWALNTYLRAALSEPRRADGREDFEPRAPRPGRGPPGPEGPAGGGRQGRGAGGGGGGEAAAAGSGSPEAPEAAKLAAASSPQALAPAAPAAAPPAGSGEAAAAAAALPPPSLAAALPGPLLEEVLRHLGYRDVAAAACTCKALSKVCCREGASLPPAGGPRGAHSVREELPSARSASVLPHVRGRLRPP
jgi:hypothetical protein